MNRRSVVSALALASVVAAAAGCTTSGSVSTVDLTRIAGDVANITSGLSALAALPAMQSALSPTTMQTLNTALADAKTLGAQIAASTVAVQLPTAQNWVQALANDAGVIVTLVATVPVLPPQATAVITAIQTLLPLVEVAVSLASTSAVGATSMTPTQARQILQDLR